MVIISKVSAIAQTSSETKGKPVHIVKRAGRTLMFDLENLRNILCSPEVAEKKVAVYSVTGDYRSGKSFLLNYILRYLRAKGVENWLGDPEEELTGFGWSGGLAKVTKGVLAWNKLFPLKLNCTEEIFVMLVDAEHINFLIRDWGNSDEYPFRNGGGDYQSHVTRHINFLIRDWGNSDEYPFRNGGGDYQSHVTRSDNSENMAQRLHRFYQTAQTHLLPCIEQGANGKKNYDGRHSGMGEEFSAHYGEVIEKWFCGSNVKQKQVGNLRFTCEELYKYCASVNELIKENGGIEKISIVEADFTYYFTRKREQYARDYSLEMESEIPGDLHHLDELHSELKSKYILKLEECDYSDKLLSVHRAQLIEEINYSYIFTREAAKDAIVLMERNADFLLLLRIFDEFKREVRQRKGSNRNTPLILLKHARDSAMRELKTYLKSTGIFRDKLKHMMEVKIAIYVKRICGDMSENSRFDQIWRDRNDEIIHAIDEYYPQKTAVDYNIEPEEFCDKLTCHLMSDPVMLPQSRVIVDRETILKHLSSTETDPFSRTPLKIEDVIFLPDLKERIHTWKAEREAHMLRQQQRAMFNRHASSYI